jgi:flavin-dependent dehydrogenase
VAISLEDEMATARHAREYLDEVVRSDPVRLLVGDSTETSYFTEVVPIGGFDARPRFHADRVLVVNDLVGVTNPLNRDGFSANLTMCEAAATTIRRAIEARNFSNGQLSRYSKRIADDVIGPVTAARRTNKALRAVEPWSWASKPELVQAGGGVTGIDKSATLADVSDSGMWKRIRRFGRLPGVGRHTPGEVDK